MNMFIFRTSSRLRGIASPSPSSVSVAAVESWNGGARKHPGIIEKIAWANSTAGGLCFLSQREPDNRRLSCQQILPFHISPVGQHVRCHSTNTNTPRAYPAFSIYGPNCVMQLSPILPVFQKSSRNGIVTKSMGKILMHFAPVIEEQEPPPGAYQTTSKYAYSRAGKIALSPEDIGALLYHVPKGETVSISRNISDTDNISSTSKVLTICLENGSVSFIFEDVQENSDGLNTNFSVTASMGEFEVLQSILRDSLPKLTGWSDLTNLNLENALRDAKNDSSYHNSGQSARPTTESRSGKSKFSTGGPGSTDRDIFSL